MKQLLLLAVVGAMVSGLSACADTASPKKTATSRKTYHTLNESTGSHLRRPYSEDNPPPVTGISSAANAGDRPFINSSAAGNNPPGAR